MSQCAKFHYQSLPVVEAQIEFCRRERAMRSVSAVLRLVVDQTKARDGARDNTEAMLKFLGFALLIYAAVVWHPNGDRVKMMIPMVALGMFIPFSRFSRRSRISRASARSKGDCGSWD